MCGGNANKLIREVQMPLRVVGRILACAAASAAAFQALPAVAQQAAPPPVHLEVQANRPGATIRPFNGNIQSARGYGEPRGQIGVRSGAFSGYNYGGQTRSFSSRGSASFGGGTAHVGGGAHGGGRGR